MKKNPKFESQKISTFLRLKSHNFSEALHVSTKESLLETSGVVLKIE